VTYDLQPKIAAGCILMQSDGFSLSRANNASDVYAGQ